MGDRPALAALAERLGIEPAFTDLNGQEHRTSDTARETLLAAMGYDVATETSAAAALTQLSEQLRERVAPAAAVCSAAAGTGATLSLATPPGAAGEFSWDGELVEESGERRAVGGRGSIAPDAESVELTLPPDLPLGYHRLAIRLQGAFGSRDATTTLILAPSSCYRADEALGDRRAFGIWANLYAVRSARNWGAGDLGDLEALVRWAGDQGASFVGINPLHALFNRGSAISPYSPVSRLFRNPLYLDVEAVPELPESPAAQSELARPETQQALAELRSADRIDYLRVMELKRRVLQPLYDTFRDRHLARRTERANGYAEFLARQGTPLIDFATFVALDEEIGRRQGSTYWREWPEGFRHPGSDAVAAFRQAHAAEVDFHCWLQFELDRQLGAAASTARHAGMALGLYQDFAVGSSGGGSDAWAFEDLFRAGATIGAPPDYYSPAGQDWGIPPIDPNRLAASGYRYWILLVRQALAHAGALRLDHAMRLRRLYWVARGQPPSEGAYVRYPEHALLGILALESRRHRAIVVGEDLGTVPPGFDELLDRWGILSSRVLYFEREADGHFRPSWAYPQRALATVTTHDHVPLAGFWQGRDLALRHALGETDQEAYHGAERWRETERELLATRLREEGIAAELPDQPALAGAVHQFLGRTPSRLVGIALDDLAGETEPVNIPGYGPDRYPVWSRRMARSLEDIESSPIARAALSAVRRERGGDQPA